jgi:hypothetical protein
MKHINPSFSDVLNEIGRAFMQTLRFCVRTVQRMSWPALLGASLLLAFVLTILPLAMVLFAFFLLLKLAVGACVIGGRRQRGNGTHAMQQEPTPQEPK